MQVLTVCPNECVSLHVSTRVCVRTHVCVCVFEAEHNKYDQSTAPGARAQITEISLRHQGPMTNTQACTYISMCVCVRKISSVTKRRWQRAAIGAERSNPRLNRSAWLQCVRMCHKMSLERGHMTVTLISCSVPTFYLSQCCVCSHCRKLQPILNKSLVEGGKTAIPAILELFNCFSHHSSEKNASCSLINLRIWCFLQSIVTSNNEYLDFCLLVEKTLKDAVRLGESDEDFFESKKIIWRPINHGNNCWWQPLASLSVLLIYSILFSL